METHRQVIIGTRDNARMADRAVEHAGAQRVARTKAQGVGDMPVTGAINAPQVIGQPVFRQQQQQVHGRIMPRSRTPVVCRRLT